MNVKDFYKYFFKVHRCAGCGEILDFQYTDSAFCPECMLKWRVAKTVSCPRCSQSAVECLCSPKGLERTGALCLVKLYFYSAEKSGQPQNKLLYRIKKNRNKRFSGFVADELQPRILAELENLTADRENDAVLVNVPRGRSARRIYGFDQSEIICEAISKKTGIPYVKLIRRARESREQKKLTRDKRFRNVSASFGYNEKLKDRVKNKYVLLFDDVVTTGASMAACVNLLKKAGAKGVICVCMASVAK